MLLGIEVPAVETMMTLHMTDSGFTYGQRGGERGEVEDVDYAEDGQLPARRRNFPVPKDCKLTKHIDFMHADKQGWHLLPIN